MNNNEFDDNETRQVIDIPKRTLLYKDSLDDFVTGKQIKKLSNIDNNKDNKEDLNYTANTEYLESKKVCDINLSKNNDKDTIVKEILE